MQHKVQRQARAAVDKEQGTNIKMNVDKKDGLVQTQINWFMSLGDSQFTQVKQARQPKRKQGNMVVSKNTITKRQRKK